MTGHGQFGAPGRPKGAELKRLGVLRGGAFDNNPINVHPRWLDSCPAKAIYPLLRLLIT